MYVFHEGVAGTLIAGARRLWARLAGAWSGGADDVAGPATETATGAPDRRPVAHAGASGPTAPARPAHAAVGDELGD